jgi:hypothetical protein
MKSRSKPLTENQIAEYREKVGSREYMERAINDIAEKFSAGCAMVKLPYAEPEITNTEEKRNGEKQFE